MERNSGIPSLADPLPSETFKCVSYRTPFRLVGEPNKTLGRPYLYKTQLPSAFRLNATPEQPVFAHFAWQDRV